VWLTGRVPSEGPARRDPTDEEIKQLQMLDATAGSPREFERWLTIARETLSKRKRGAQKKEDDHWLLCAAALEEHDRQSYLSKTAAITKIAERVAIRSNRKAFIRRLVHQVKDHPSLSEWARSSHPDHRIVFNEPFGFVISDERPERKLNAE
jgi:hypothetical protein